MVSYSSADIALLVGLKDSQSEFLKFQFFFVLGAQIYEFKARKKVWINLHWIILPFAILPLFLDTYLGYIAATLSCLFLLTERNHPNIIKVWPLVALGNICYSLYLIHIPVWIYCDNKLPALNSFAVASLALLASIATFFLIEVPFIQVGKFINMRITAGKY